MFKIGLNLLLSVEHTKVDTYFKETYEDKNFYGDISKERYAELDKYVTSFIKQLFDKEYVAYYSLPKTCRTVLDYFTDFLYSQVTKEKDVVRISLLNFDVHPIIMYRFLTFLHDVADNENKKVVLHTHNLAAIDWFTDYDVVFVMTEKTPIPTNILELHDGDWLAQAKLSTTYTRLLLTNHKFSE